jgi:hypothetical protein
LEGRCSGEVGLAPIGIIANPASGKDIRRLVAHASVFDNQEKRNIVRRAVLGAMAAGTERFIAMAEPNGLVEAAMEGAEGGATLEFAPSSQTASALDTERAASFMRDAGCGAVITLGGDGTNRATVRGWQAAPLVAISTGTNNVFPSMLEGTTAGAAAGLVACGKLSLAEASSQAKLVHVEVDDEPPDVALIDAVLLAERFVGSRAIWHPEKIRSIVLTRAEPTAMGMSAIGGLLSPVAATDDCGLIVRMGEGCGELRAPIAPGMYQRVAIADYRRLAFGESVSVEGPGILALDGERERLLKAGQRAHLTIRRDGPWVIDVSRALRIAGCRGLFRTMPGGGSDGC